MIKLINKVGDEMYHPVKCITVGMFTCFVIGINAMEFAREVEDEQHAQSTQQTQIGDPTIHMSRLLELVNRRNELSLDHLNALYTLFLDFFKVYGFPTSHGMLSIIRDLNEYPKTEEIMLAALAKAYKHNPSHRAVEGIFSDLQLQILNAAEAVQVSKSDVDLEHRLKFFAKQIRFCEILIQEVLKPYPATLLWAASRCKQILLSLDRPSAWTLYTILKRYSGLIILDKILAHRFSQNSFLRNPRTYFWLYAKPGPFLLGGVGDIICNSQACLGYGASRKFCYAVPACVALYWAAFPLLSNLRLQLMRMGMLHERYLDCAQMYSLLVKLTRINNQEKEIARLGHLVKFAKTQLAMEGHKP